MINKEEIIKLIENKKYQDVLNQFSEDYLINLKSILDFHKIPYNDNLTLIECVSIVECRIPNSEIILHVPMETIYNESREIESRVSFAVNWYDRWLENINNMRN